MGLRLLVLLLPVALCQWNDEPGFIGGAQNPGGLGGAVGGTLKRGRDAQLTSKQTSHAIQQIMAQLTADDLGNLPVDIFDALPASVLAQLPPTTLASLPPSILDKLAEDANKKGAVCGEIIRHLKADVLVQQDWVTLVQCIPPDAWNTYPPSLVGAVPWETVWPEMPTDAIAGMSLDALLVIPPTAWEKTSFEQLEAIQPEVLATLPLSHLKAIPLEHLQGLSEEHLQEFSVDVLRAIDPSLVDLPGAGAAGETNAEAIGLAGTLRRRGSRRGTWQ